MSGAAGADKKYDWFWRSRTPELIVGTIFINILAIALPIFSMQVYDRVMPSRASQTLIMLVIGVIVAIGLEIALRIERGKIISKNGATFERNLSRAAIRRVLNSSLDDLSAQTASQRLQQLQAIRAFRDFHSGYALTVLIDFSFVFLYLALIFQIGGLLVLAPLAIVVFILANGLAGSLYLRDAIAERRAADEARYGFLVSTLQSMNALKCFSLEKLFERRYEPLQYATSAANFRVSKASANMLNTSMVLGNLMTASVVSIGVFIATSGSFTIGAIIACIMLSGRLISPLQRGMILWMKYQEYDASREQFFSLIGGGQDAARVIDEAKNENARRVLTLRRFNAPIGDSAPLHFREGDIVRIRAEAPQKASRLLKIIAGLAPQAGAEIIIDGRPLSSIPLAKRAAYVGYLAPGAELFNGAILDNLTSFGLRERHDALKVARSLGIDKEVARMPNGWNTVISGKQGDEAPTGLKQRIAIARALAARPRVILVDEACELLDNRSYDLTVTTLLEMSAHSVILLNTADENFIRFCNRDLQAEGAGAALTRRRSPLGFGEAQAL
ncbi:ABC transporter transmembrane domain-containing protein [Hyphococcus luteus]|uniref:ABC transporter n=1 Tax=Hyphococcus luteus TaxID=2058213 RepID=A0A2S7KA37_9PROT|nr:ABC transporter transmembrane domain-containing protein [Marinicaulis flavus]PQA89384.1 hypothetical protein CW354_00460 [Marinicaulis flavus]